MAKNGYKIIRRFYDEFWDEQETIWFHGPIRSQGEVLFEGLTKMLGERDICLLLYDEEGNLINEYTH